MWEKDINMVMTILAVIQETTRQSLGRGYLQRVRFAAAFWIAVDAARTAGEISTG